MVGQHIASNSRRNVRMLNRDKLKEKALKMKMKEKLTHTVCIRIQTQLKKTPEVSRRLGAYIVNKMIKEGLESEPPHEAFVELVREAAKATATRTSIPTPSQTTSKSSRGLSSREQRLAARQREMEQTARASAYMTEAQHQQASIGFKVEPRMSPTKIQKADIWSEIVDYAAVEEQQKKQQTVEKTVKTRQDWTSVLERQLQEKEQAALAQRKENERYHELGMKNLEKANAIQREEEEKRIRIAKEQHLAQEEQRRIKEAEIQKQNEIKAYQEERMVAMIQQQQEMDEARERARKQAERAKMQIVMKENEDWLDHKEKVKEQEREYERQLAEQYIKMEEAKDEKRRLALEEQSKRILAKMKHFDDTAKAENDQREKQEELRCLRYQMDYEKRIEQEEAERKRALRERHRAQQEELKRQMQVKKEKERKEKDEHSQQAVLWKHDCAEAKRKERYEAKQRLQRNKMQQDWLRDQIRERERKNILADHTPLEMQLNKSILSKIQKSQQVVQETHERSNQLNKNM